VLQFVLIKPVTAVLAIVLDKNGVYHEGSFDLKSGYFYLAAINNISVSLSLYCLVLFYMATEERLKPFSPFSKFLCIKAIIFFSFWQACLFIILLKLNLFDDKVANLAQSLIISVEMVFAAIAQSFAFSYNSFLDNQKKKGNMLKTIGYVLNVKDVISDAHNTFIKDHNKDIDNDTQMDDMLKDKAFNWSDEEMASLEKTTTSETSILKKHKYKKSPPRKGGSKGKA